MLLGRKIEDTDAARWLATMERLLLDGEEPLLLVRSRYQPDTDLVLLTNKRITAWHSKWLATGPRASVPWGDVEDRYRRGDDSDIIIRRRAGGEVNLGSLHREDHDRFNEAYWERRRLDVAPAPSADKALIDRLDRLAALYERQLLSDDEFVRAKQLLLWTQPEEKDAADSGQRPSD